MHAAEQLLVRPRTSAGVFDGGERENLMLRWAIGFFVVAILAAFLGFGGIAGDAAVLAKICFLIFLVLAVVSLIFGRGRVA
jgi:uncharacterized membrane protein YtjA (UPF0391 family)